MMDTAEISRVAEAGKALELARRGERWCHLSLCLIDDVFSIGAKYGSTWRAARRYAEFAGLEPATAPATAVSGGRYESTEEQLRAFLDRVSELPPRELAAILANHQRTSTRGGILKADAVVRFARILVDHEINRLGDVSTMLADTERTNLVEASLATVPGHGSGVRVSYLWMLAGDDLHVKADRMVIRWMAQVLDRHVGVDEAAVMIQRAAAQLDVTPWMLDHAVWNHQRGRR